MAINWLAVVVGTLGYQILGALWYGPLFGTRWMATMGYSSQEDMSDENPMMGYLITTIGSLIATITLAFLVDLVGIYTWQMGLQVGILGGVGLIATTGLQSVQFERRSWTVYLLNAGYNVIALAGIGVLLGVWQ